MNNRNFVTTRNNEENYSIPKWYFTKQELLRVPSILDGMSPEQEFKYRQQASIFMRDMGEKLINGIKEQRVKMSCCMCVAMIHLHRFFVVHSMRIFDPRDIAAACLFLAGKSEDYPRKLELISRTWYNLKHKNDEKARPFDQKVCEESGEYIVFLESVVLQTIGFKLEVGLPHPLILKYAQKFLKDKLNLMETAYFFATDLLFMTNWCVRYKMETLACVCIHLTCTWAEHKIPQVSDSLPWYKIIDPEMTEELLNDLADEFTKIYEEADKSQLVSTKRLVEWQSRIQNASNAVTTVSSTSSFRQKSTNSTATNSLSFSSQPSTSNAETITANSSHQTSKLYPQLNNKNSTNSNNYLSSATVVLPPPPTAPTLNNNTGYTEILAPPPRPPQINNSSNVTTNYETKEEAVVPAKKRKVTLAEYRERKRATTAS